MIDYSPFWMTLQNSDESTYTLIKDYKVSGSTIDRLRKNAPISTVTLNDLCTILECDVYYGKNVPLFRRNGYRKSGTMIP